MQCMTSRLAQRRAIDTLEEHGANDFLPRATSVSRSVCAAGEAERRDLPGNAVDGRTPAGTAPCLRRQEQA